MKWSLFSRASRSRRSPPTPQTPQAPQPCLQCKTFIRQFFTDARPGSHFFQFSHRILAQRFDSEAGCPVCDFAVRTSEDIQAVEIRGGKEQATIYWTTAFEFFEPGMLASTQELARLEESHEAGYEPPEWENAYDLQRDAPARTDDPACFELVRTWIQKCCYRHPNCSRATSTRLPTRVICVGEDGNATNPFLLETNGEEGLYVALSHRWGSDLTFTTTLANLETHKRGMALRTLPATFRDAVVLCRKVGIKFLWIDAICIIQGCAEDWDREAGRMASIYRHAVFTISALHASSSHSGLFCERKKPLSIKFASPLEGNGRSPEMGMRVAAPGFGREMEKSPLTPRGWVYQERALSTATLHFGRHQIFWECRNKIISEYSSQVHNFSSAEALTFDFGRCLWHLRPMPGLLQNGSNGIKEWEFVVESFSRTRFTVATDRFPAICGVATLFKDVTTNPSNTFVGGLWSAFLFRQLLWVYDERDKAGMLGPPERDLRWVPRGWKPRFPSWSWISVDYPVCTMAADELPSMFKVVSIERAHSTTFTNNSNGPALALRLWGQLQWFDWPAQQLDRQKSAEITFQTRRGQHLIKLNVKVDPGCSIPENAAGLIVSESTWILRPYHQIFFLVLEQVNHPEPGFRRIGIGSGPKDVVEMAFMGAGFREITLL